MKTIDKIALMVTGGAALLTAGVWLGSRQKPVVTGALGPGVDERSLQKADSRLLMVAPVGGRIGIEEAQRLLEVLGRVKGPLSIAIHAMGGTVHAVDHMALALKKYPGRITAFVPYRAMSGGTVLALAADEIVMSPRAVLGPVDPQIAGFPAHAIEELVRLKPIERLDEQWFMLGVESRKALAETRALLEKLDVNPTAIARLTGGTTTHASPIGHEEAQALGLNVRVGIPPRVHRAVDAAVRRNEDYQSCMPRVFRI